MSHGYPEPLVFLRSLLNDPLKIGALAPSSSRLSRLIASRVDPSQSSVLEIGAGTGAITTALLRRGVGPERLFIIERDPVLAEFLQNRFPRVRVHCGDAVHAPRILSLASIDRVETIVSSVPLLNLPKPGQLEIVRAMMKALATRGQILQFTYGATCPVPTRKLGLEAERLGRVWMNFPPATVWRFTKKHTHSFRSFQRV